jgi:hypothetical protein
MLHDVKFDADFVGRTGKGLNHDAHMVAGPWADFAAADMTAYEVAMNFEFRSTH